MRAAFVLLMLGASPARADVATWTWEVGDTGNGDGVIEPGESALLRLWIAFDPPQPQTGGGLAQAGPYDILGNAVWARGRVEFYDNLLDDGVPEGRIDDDNNIRDLEHFQVWLIFGDLFDSDNPVDVFVMKWTPASYAPSTVALSGRAEGAWI
jgi:hypothetical protein